MITYKKIYNLIVFILFFSFMVLYISQKNGYYDSINYQKKRLTEEGIKKFEEDVKNNKKINVNDYVMKEEKDYSNFYSDFGYETSKVFSKVFKKIMIKIFGGLDLSN